MVLPSPKRTSLIPSLNYAVSPSPTFKARTAHQLGKTLNSINKDLTGSRDLNGDKKDPIPHIRSELLPELEENYNMKNAIGQ